MKSEDVLEETLTQMAETDFVPGRTSLHKVDGK